MSGNIWHTAKERPEEARRVYIRLKDGTRLLCWFDCAYLCKYELQSLDRCEDLDVLIEDVEIWAYIEDLEGDK